MSTYFYMQSDLFDKWVNMLLEESYDWKQIGISNDYCNTISVPKYGLELVDWTDHSFNIIDDKKYAFFILKYQ